MNTNSSFLHRILISILLSLVLLAYSCTRPTEVEQTPCPEPNMTIKPPSEIIVDAGDPVMLTTIGSEIGWTYSWSADSLGGIFSHPDKRSTQYIVPQHSGTIIITLIVTNRCDETKEDTLRLTVVDVAPQSTLTTITHIPTITPTITLTITPTITPTIAPTITPTITPTIAPTITPTITPTPVPVIIPTAVPVPTSLSVEWAANNVLLLKWNWTGALQEHWHFAVRFWPEGRPDLEHSLVWTNENQYALPVNNDTFPIGNYLFNVGVVEDLPPYGSGENGAWRAMAESESLLVPIPDIPPTPPPPPTLP